MWQGSRLGVWTVGLLVAGALAPAGAAEPASDTRNLPPVVEMGVGTPASVSPSREALADLLVQLETLQREVRALRGQVEVQGHELERLKTRQRELLSEIDRRVSELERTKTATAAPPPVAADGGGGATSSAAPAVSPGQEQADYDAAFSLMKQGKYEQAAKAFSDFLAKYPNGVLRDNAQYWLGEAYYVVRNFRQALTEFNKLISAYPQSLKTPDAQLKIGYSHYELGEWAKAREHLNQIVARYPGQPVAKSAEQRLAKMRKEGR